MTRYFRCGVGLLLGSAAFGAAHLAAQNAPANATAAGVPAAVAGPKARFAQTSFDFGKVLPSAIQQHEFVVTNVGSETLRISEVNPGCGCTTTGGWDREIAPGKSGRIPIQFNPSNFNGAVTKSISVATNDVAQPTHILQITANVWRPFELSPGAFVNFLPVDGEAVSETKVVRIVNNLDAPATLQPPQSSSPRFKAELKTVQPGREFELHVAYDHAATTAEPHATLSIKTSNPEQPELTVTALVLPQPAVVTMPAVLQLPAGPAATSHNIVIRNNASAALKVTEPTTTIPGAVVTISEAQPGKLFYVSVTFPREFKADTEQSAVVSVRTSHPKFPEIRVPVVAAAAGGGNGTAGAASR